MKNLFLTLMITFWASNACAQCVGKIVDYYEHPTIKDGRLIIEVEYSVDGVISPNNDKWTVFPEMLDGKTKAQIVTAIENRMKRSCGRRVISEWKKDSGNNLLTVFQNNDADLRTITAGSSTGEIYKDNDDDGYYEEKWVVSTDGSKSVVALDPPIAIR